MIHTFFSECLLQKPLYSVMCPLVQLIPVKRKDKVIPKLGASYRCYFGSAKCFVSDVFPQH